MIIAHESITTEEVKDWQGLHLLHFHGSTCSQKVRLMLGELGVDWESHPVSLMKSENSTPWFLGINPRGVVPVLVHDGVVHVESNDIITYLDSTFSKPRQSYFFEQSDPLAEEAQQLLDKEDELHIDLRTLTIQFGPLKIKTEKEIDAQDKNGAADAQRDHEVHWWRDKLANGISDAETRESCARFAALFDELDQRLATRSWLMGDDVSIVDISLFTNIQRLVNLGYPLQHHSRLHEYYQRLTARPAFETELSQKTTKMAKKVFRTVRFFNGLKGKRIEKFV